MTQNEKQVLSFDEWWKKHNCVMDSLSREAARYVYESRQTEIDELQKRIDESIEFLEIFEQDGTIIKILKGESNENQ